MNPLRIAVYEGGYEEHEDLFADARRGVDA